MRKQLVVLLITIFLTRLIFADVPLPVTRQPDVPYFMEPFNFKTIELSLFTSDVSGMVRDYYGDLSWNPAYLLNIQKRALYLNLNFYTTNTSDQTVVPMYGVPDYLVYPNWYGQTYIAQLQNRPQYNIALLMPLTEKLKIGVTNRTIFDYGPFRESYSWDYRYLETNAYFDRAWIADDLEPQRLEVDDNQQFHFGVQTEAMAGYRLNQRFDLGLKIGNYTYRRDGDLYDSRHGTYPHSSFADLNKEDLGIDGNQFIVGAGLLYHKDDKTTWGIYGEWITGNADESSHSIDTSYSWSERDTDPSYFSLNDYDMTSRQSFDDKAKRQSLNVTFEKKLSEKLLFRSFLRYSQSKSDLSFSTMNIDTGFSDRTYDTYDNGYHFQRMTSSSKSQQIYNGDGEEKTARWKWFASYIYRTGEDWSIFGGILVDIYHIENQYREESDYFFSKYSDRQLYDPKTYQYLNTNQKKYEYTCESDQYTASIPIGIKIQVIDGFKLIFGGEIHYFYDDNKTKGRLLYPYVISRKWENNVITVNDHEVDRYEEYSSEPATDLYRTTNVNLGFTYAHSSGIKISVRSNGNILETGGWDIGLEYRW